MLSTEQLTGLVDEMTICCFSYRSTPQSLTSWLKFLTVGRKKKSCIEVYICWSLRQLKDLSQTRFSKTKQAVYQGSKLVTVCMLENQNVSILWNTLSKFQIRDIIQVIIKYIIVINAAFKRSCNITNTPYYFRVTSN